MRKIFYDFEFVEDGKTIDPISLGMIDDKRQEYYAIINDFTTISRAVNHPWLRENVIPHLPIRFDSLGWWSWDETHPDFSYVKPRPLIVREVTDFIIDSYYLLKDAQWFCELWGWLSGYDHVALAQLIGGSMIDLPVGVPMFTHDLYQLWEKVGRPTKPPHDFKHNALDDARWNYALYEVCEGLPLS
jgi:hypothetical protein